MATMAADPVVVDTNILIYAQQALSPFHATATARLHALGLAGNPLWISRQTLREYLAAMSRTGALTTPVSMAALLADVRRFQGQFLVADDNAAVTTQPVYLLGVTACAGKQVHDANIVATMMVHGVGQLLTHNVADFNRFAPHITMMPLEP